ncbi:MAG: tetraacyldisaccharide 4'-kinase [Acidobacteria bacterium]|nr:tetraacyldisaccharide 4'-kinase [Acidobacteriota bacterium]
MNMTLQFPLSTAAQAAMNLYASGAGVRTWLYRRGWIPQQRLRAKVVSIGNISWGGTGKTPFTIWLAQRLSAAGIRASILTRGYGRSSTEPVRFFFPGASADDARRDGDEVQLYLRHRVMTAIGIADSRYDAGRTIEERFRVDLHLLDDGFQHLSMARDLDIVLVDAANPWGARWGLPRVLRESPRSLRRANAIVITNCGLLGDDQKAGLESLRKTLLRWNPQAPHFLASTRLVGFVERLSQRIVSVQRMQGRRALTFCGLGNPDNFFAMLKAAGVPCTSQEQFHDHHRYQMDDLKKLENLAEQHHADCLITTEKDLMNLPDASAFDFPLYWAETQMLVEAENQLLGWIGEKLGVSIVLPAAVNPTTGEPGGRRSPSALPFLVVD